MSSKTPSVAGDWRKVVSCLGWVAFVVIMFAVAVYAVAGLQWILQQLGWLNTLNANMLNLLTQTTMYFVMTLLLFVAARAMGRSVTARQAGVGRLIDWRDIGLASIGLVAYVVLTVTLAWVAQSAIPWYDSQQIQDVGVSGKLFSADLLVAFIAFVVAAPFFEELIFRGILYGKLRSAKLATVPVALVVSVLFPLANVT